MKPKLYAMMIGKNEYARTYATNVKDAWRKIRAENNGICGIISPHLKTSLVYLARGNNQIETVTATLEELTAQS